MVLACAKLGVSRFRGPSFLQQTKNNPFSVAGNDLVSVSNTVDNLDRVSRRRCSSCSLSVRHFPSFCPPTMINLNLHLQLDRR